VVFPARIVPEYGKLSKKDLSGIEDGARVDLDEYEKTPPRLRLWKAAKPGEHSWDTPSAAAAPAGTSSARHGHGILGESFDLHAAAKTHVSASRERDRPKRIRHAQDICRHWMHVRFLLVDGRKMSKSEGNFFTLRDLLLKGYKASAIRLALISVPTPPAQLHLRRLDRGTTPSTACERFTSAWSRHGPRHLCRGSNPRFKTPLKRHKQTT